MTETPNVLIVDDHPLFRDALETALAQASSDAGIATHAGSIKEALERFVPASTTLVLLDLKPLQRRIMISCTNPTVTARV